MANGIQAATTTSERSPAPRGDRARGHGRVPPWVGLLVWCGALVVGTAVFHGLGRGPLSAPPLDPHAWSAWLDGREPLVAAVAVLRLLVLALSWYLVGVTSVGVAARALRRARLVRLADALVLPPLRRTLQTALGFTLAGVMVAAATGNDGRPVTLAAAPADDGREAEVVPRPLELVREGGAADGEGDTPASDDDLRGRRDGDDGDVPEVDDDAPEVDGDAPRADAAGDRAGERTDGGGEMTGEVEVVTGDSFWHIAERTLRRTLQRRPSDAETAGYTALLIERNRQVLADPDNPDLIFPGQRFTLPDVPTVAG
jgi:hypothetical protein